MKNENTFKRMLAPAAIVLSLSLSGYAAETRADTTQDPIQQNKEAQDIAANDANQAAINDGIQQGLTGQITGELYSIGLPAMDPDIEVPK